MKNVAIIGAGLSGLLLAKELSSVANVKVFEKARGVGGRMSTRYAGEYEFDHGAQFFTVRSEGFQKQVNEWEQQQVVARWNARFVELSRNQIQHERLWGDDPIHYVGTPRMNSIAKYLSQTLSVDLNAKVITIHQVDEKIQLEFENGERSDWFDWVISTAPVEQTLALLPLEFTHRSLLEQIKMQGCYALMLGFKEPINLLWDVALVKDSLLSWVSVNSSKPGRNDLTTVVALASNDWADEHIEFDREWVIQNMLQEVTHVMGHDLSQYDYLDLHRWRYANAEKINLPQAMIDQQHRMAVCGDWCVSGRVESAYLSARQLWENLIPLLS